MAVEIDSILWTGSSLPTSSTIRLFPCPQRSRTINIHNHYYVSIEGKNVKLSNITNFEIGQFGTNGIFRINIFFPRMRKQTNGRWVTSVEAGEMKTFYDKIVYLILQEILSGAALNHWPCGYSDAEYRSRSQLTGKYEVRGYELGGGLGRTLFNEAREKITEISEWEWIQWVLFIHLCERS